MIKLTMPAIFVLVSLAAAAQTKFSNIISVALGQPLVREVKLDNNVLSRDTGIYELAEKKPGKGRLFTRLEKGKLYATLSNGTGRNMYMSPLSDTLFVLPDVKKIYTTIEMININGRVTGLYWTQEKKIECRKVE